jgi:hypothetical protein
MSRLFHEPQVSEIKDKYKKREIILRLIAFFTQAAGLRHGTAA